MATANPKSVTIRGRLSFPRFTHKEAVANALKSNIPAIAAKAASNPEDISPEFNLLIEQDQLDKLVEHIRDVFLPYVNDQFAKKEKRDALDPKVVAKILKKMEDGDYEAVAPHLPMKEMSEKNKESAPECVVGVKITGNKGRDITLKARVDSEDQLAIPDADLLQFPVLKNLSETVFEMYPGAYVGATLNLFAFFSSASVNGISAGASTAVYLGNLEGERFGGGDTVDEDALFMD